MLLQQLRSKLSITHELEAMCRTLRSSPRLRACPCAAQRQSPQQAAPLRGHHQRLQPASKHGQHTGAVD
jgi:hypothetical protein